MPDTTETAQVLPKKYARITFGYSSVFIIPYADLPSFLESFNSVERYDKSTFDAPKILPVKSDDFEISIMSEEEYNECRMLDVLVNTEKS